MPTPEYDDQFSQVALLMHAEGSLADSSSYGHAVTASGGAAWSDAEARFGSGSIHLPQGGYASATAALSLALTQDLWSIEFQIKVDAPAGPVWGCENYSFGATIAPYALVYGSTTGFATVDVGGGTYAMTALNDVGTDASRIGVPITPRKASLLSCVFRLTALRSDDALCLDLCDAEDQMLPLVQFNPRREPVLDSGGPGAGTGRARVVVNGVNTTISTAALAVDTWYEFVLTLNDGVGTSTAQIKSWPAGAVLYAVTLPGTIVVPTVDRLLWHIDSHVNLSEAQYLSVELCGEAQAAVDPVGTFLAGVPTSGGAGAAWWMGIGEDGKLTYRANGSERSGVGPVLPADQWTQIMLRSRVSGAQRFCELFVDATLADSWDSSLGANMTAPCAWTIGQAPAEISAGDNPPCWIDELRITPGVTRPNDLQTTAFPGPAPTFWPGWGAAWPAGAVIL